MVDSSNNSCRLLQTGARQLLFGEPAAAVSCAVNGVVVCFRCPVKYSMKPEMVDKVRKRAEARKRGGPGAVGEHDPWSCDEIPPPLFYVGLEQFNRGEYF